MLRKNIGIGPTGTSIRTGPPVRQRRSQRLPSSSGADRPQALQPEDLASAANDGFFSSDAIVLAAVQLLLDPPHVAEGAVVEDDRDHGMLCWTAVASSWTLNMKPPSPLIETTVRSGLPTCAPSAVGKP